MNPHIFLSLCWIVYCALHSILAAGRVKGWTARTFPKLSAYYRIGYILFALMGLVAIILYQLWMPTSFLWMQHDAVLVVGLIVMTSGLLLMAVCIKKYFAGLSGLQALNENFGGNKLQITGVHRYVRHPLYSGTFVFLWGAWLAWPALSFLLSNIIITVYTVWALRWEEAKLIREFGADYLQYRKRVPALVPQLF